ncbi:DUF6445 family protein [Thalassomonas sp. M1454]|uniref:DUF6445 family protein n=1 Tax=Thalassomonas sp. M1454 TaxID=2594477 RepID=UPI0021B1201B|nr:DUF6445 family protein [Thalassomonas sp. M1454]
MSEFSINPSIKPMIKLVGKEKTPVIVIDDFATDLSEIVDDAVNNQTFVSDPNSYYPGVRSRVPQEYVLAILKTVYQGIYKVYDIPRSLKLKLMLNYFSLINTPEEELSLLQRIPHFDTPRPYYFAILHYLNPGQHGGTGLFRHTLSDFERINDERVDGYMQSTEQYMQEHGELPPKYHNTSSKLYQLYEEIPYKPNRLVIYPGNLLHSTIVDLKNDIDGDPRTGRLTSNIFVEFK